MAFAPKNIKIAEQPTKNYIEFTSKIIKMINNNDGNYSIYITYNGVDYKADGNTFIFKKVIDSNLEFKFYGYIDENKIEILKISLIPHLPSVNKFLVEFIGIEMETLPFLNDPLLFLTDINSFKKIFKNSTTDMLYKRKVINKINEYYLLNDLIDFLLTYEIDEKISSNIFNYYNNGFTKVNISNYEQLESFKRSFLRSPYFLTDLPFIKFSLIDYIGLNKLKISKDNETRLRYLIKTELFDYITKNGDTFIFYNDFTSKFNKTFNNLDKMVKIGVESKDIIIFTINYDGVLKKCITVSTLYRSEVNIKDKLLNINNNKDYPCKGHTDIINRILDNEKEFLTKKQIKTIKELLKNKISILTGGPGTGKTTIIKYITNILEKLEINYCLLSPTGKAASRITEVTKKEAKTIHRAFGINSFFVNENEKRIKKEDFYIIDEASMLCNQVFEIFISTIPESSQIILVGDRDQLPPVEYGNIFYELIKSNKFHTSILTEIHRTKNGSDIPTIAKKINNSESIESNSDYINNDFAFIPASSDDEILEKMMIVSDDFIKDKKYSSYDVQVLTPQNNTELGVKNLNIILKDVFNPSFRKKINIKTFSVGDKVIQNKNNYDKNVYNGEIGIVKDNDLVNEIISIEFNNRVINFNNNVKEIDLAYAITIHKSQGSESAVVIIPISKQHSFMLNKNLIYTGITRGKEKVILIGDLKLFNESIKKITQNKKLTLISYLLNR